MIIVFGDIHEKVLVVLMATALVILVMKGFSSDGSGKGNYTVVKTVLMVAKVKKK